MNLRHQQYSSCRLKSHWLGMRRFGVLQANLWWHEGSNWSRSTSAKLFTSLKNQVNFLYDDIIFISMHFKVLIYFVKLISLKVFSFLSVLLRNERWAWQQQLNNSILKKFPHYISGHVTIKLSSASHPSFRAPKILRKVCPKQDNRFKTFFSYDSYFRTTRLLPKHEEGGAANTKRI